MPNRVGAPHVYNPLSIPCIYGGGTLGINRGFSQLHCNFMMSMRKHWPALKIAGKNVDAKAPVLGGK